MPHCNKDKKDDKVPPPGKLIRRNALNQPTDKDGKVIKVKNNLKF